MAASSSSTRIRDSYSVNPSSTVIDCSEVISNFAATWLILSDVVSRSSNQITNCLIGNPAPGHRADSAARLMTGPRVAVRAVGKAKLQGEMLQRFSGSLAIAAGVRVN